MLFNKIIGNIFRRSASKGERKSFVFPSNLDGSLFINSSVGGLGSYSAYVDLDNAIKNEYQLITRYRDMTMQPEVDKAVDHIVSDAIVSNPGDPVVEIILDKTDLPDTTKNKIRQSFEKICRLLDINNQGYDIFRRWFVDGRLYYYIKLNEKWSRQEGISELQYVDPRQIKKVRELAIRRNLEEGVDEVVEVDQYFVYSQQGFLNTNHINADQSYAGSGGGGGSVSQENNSVFTYNSTTSSSPQWIQQNIKLSTDAVVCAHSNIVDPSCRVIVSYLHQAIRFVNLLRMLEDAIIIYRIARAPERRVFYVDTGGLPPKQAQAHLEQVMRSYRNQTTYDAVTGETRDDKRHLSMLDDFWIPRTDSTSGTEVQVLAGGQNLGQMDDLEYFQNKLYEALKVPLSRFRQADKGFSMGRTSEITQDELQFSRHIKRLRSNFSVLFDELLEKELILTKVLTKTEWDEVKEKIYYEFNTDSHFSELKDAELLKERLALLRDISEYEGRYFSKKYIQTNVLQMSEDEIDDIEKEIDKEAPAREAALAKEAELSSTVTDTPLETEKDGEKDDPLSDEFDNEVDD